MSVKWLCFFLLRIIDFCTGRERQRERERETERQRETETETGRQTDRLTGREEENSPTSYREY